MPFLLLEALNLTYTSGLNTSISHTDAYSHHPSWLQIFRMIVLCLQVVLTLLGNSLILAGVRRIEEMRSVTGLFLANLAISDLGTGLFCLPIAIAATADEDLLKIRFLCNMDGFSLVLFFIGSIQTLCAISVHKYIAVVYAMKVTFTRNRAYLLISVIWIISLLLATGPLFGWSKFVYKAGRHQCSPPAPENTAMLTHMIMLLSFGYVVPLLTMLYCYSRIYCTTKAHLRRLRTNAILDTISTTESDLINTLVLVLLCFIICWLPFVVLISYGMTRQPIPYYLPTIAFLFGYGNSALNPIIYALRHKSFRMAFKTILCTLTGSNRYFPDNTLATMANNDSPIGRARQTAAPRPDRGTLVAEPLIKDGVTRMNTDGSDCGDWKVDRC